MFFRLRTLAIIVLLIAVTSVSVFLFFKGFFEAAHTNLTEQILAAVLGTVMISMITVLLLSAQSKVEEGKEKSLGVFQHKLDVYSRFLDFVYDIIEDGKLETHEICELCKWTTRIALLGGETATLMTSAFAQQCLLTGKFRYEDLTKENKKVWREWYKEESGELSADESMDFVSVGMLASYLREDLGEARVANEDHAISGAMAIDTLVERISLGRHKDA